MIPERLVLTTLLLVVMLATHVYSFSSRGEVKEYDFRLDLKAEKVTEVKRTARPTMVEPPLLTVKLFQAHFFKNKFTVVEAETGESRFVYELDSNDQLIWFYIGSDIGLLAVRTFKSGAHGNAGDVGIHAFDLRAGGSLWSHEEPSAVYMWHHIDPNILVTALYKSEDMEQKHMNYIIYAFDLKTGKLLWSHERFGVTRKAFDIGEGRIAVERLTTLDVLLIATGIKVYSFPKSGWPVSLTSLDRDNWLLKTKDGLYRLDLKNGNAQWKFLISGSDGFHIQGNSLFLGLIEQEGVAKVLHLNLVAGTVLAEYKIQTYKGFYDMASITILNSGERELHVITCYTILE